MRKNILAVAAALAPGMRKNILTVAAALALGMATMTTAASARGGGGHFGGGGGHFSGSAGHLGGGGGHFAGRGGFGGGAGLRSGGGIRTSGFHHGGLGNFNGSLGRGRSLSAPFARPFVRPFVRNFPFVFFPFFPFDTFTFGEPHSVANQVSAPYNAQQAPLQLVYSEYAGAANGGEGGVAYGGGGYAGPAGKMAQNCAGLATAATQVPIGQIRETVHATDDQQAILDEVGAASSRAKGIIQDACETKPGPSPVGRLDAAKKQFEAMAQAMQAIQSPLDKFYASLNEDQKAKLNNLNNLGVSPPPASSQETKQDTKDVSSPSAEELGLKVGTRVKLRSGGPLMTVHAIHGSEVTCVWFGDAGDAQSATFPAVSLMRMTGP